jgi:hypothetical protein
MHLVRLVLFSVIRLCVSGIEVKKASRTGTRRQPNSDQSDALWTGFGNQSPITPERQNTSLPPEPDFSQQLALTAHDMVTTGGISWGTALFQPNPIGILGESRFEGRLESGKGQLLRGGPELRWELPQEQLTIVTGDFENAIRK